MIYLDYAANTPASEKSIERFAELERKFSMNPNSNNPLASEAKALLESSMNQVAACLGISKDELVFTSGGTESNNLAIKGLAAEYGARRKHIITSFLEHSSVLGPVGELQKQGYDIDYVNLDGQGHIDIEHLQSLLRKDTLLVSLCQVDSELGICQDIVKLGQLIKEESKAYFHVDGTQALGKIDVDLTYVDLYSFTAHKFYGLNQSGCLVVKKDVIIEPLHHGGLSLSPYRSGTPSLSLNVTLCEAFLEMNAHKGEHYQYALKLNQGLRKFFAEFEGLLINSPKSCLPYILNISLKSIKGEDLKNRLADKGIYLSTKSACSAPNAPSRAVFALTKDRKRARSTLRISLSHLTCQQDLEYFMKVFEDMVSKTA